MALGRLAARLRGHDWVAALIELLIVILGILIALQVSNWNQDRLDRKRGQDYVRRINDELQTDLRRIEATRIFWRQVGNYGRAAIEYGEAHKLAGGSAWKTVLSFYQASQILPFELEDTSFREMRDAGDLGLIRDERLRKRLSEYYRLTGEGITSQILRHDPVYRHQIRGLTPLAVQEYIWAKCFRQLEGVQQELLDCPSPMPEADAEALLRDFLASDDLLQQLRIWHTTLGVSMMVIGTAEDQAKELELQTAY